ncbi:hypothetical protein QNI16_01370 [Cytophagaceae bacterium YF14B1]|uniref:Uncharacterized protein n=1 Tax=Xanthocytophaga flava TaxID=3048013 RepID=A0AAE3QLH7_9BACT|nr:hypothetical protein [Xanthocytophaga flavus]MDJ1479111.1 hypothetical protein [Xanthocytophaga flavus]
MKKVVSLPICFFWLVYTYAQQETFDLTTYIPPQGWKKEQKKDVVTYTITDQKAKTWCTLALYAGIASKGSSNQDFSSEWQQLIVSQYNSVGSPQINPIRNVNGWQMKSGGAEFVFNKTNALAMLTTFTGYGKCISIVVLTNGEQYLATIQNFISSVTLQGGDGKSTATPVSSSGTKPIPTGQKATVWMNVQLNPLDGSDHENIATASANVKFYVVYSDGDYYPEMPSAGLQSFDKNRSQTGKDKESWGKFSLQNGKGAFRSKYENIQVEQVNLTQLKKVGYAYNFYKCASVDGLTLQGRWSYIPNWSKDPYYSQAGCRQVIYFSKDGTFDDRGIWVSDCRYPTKNPQDAPGKGTYRIQNFTIILTYLDGRIIHKAFTGVADKNPATYPDLLYIGTNPFYSK